ncbi:MAG: hypothetical protein ACK4WM_04985 [Thermoflexales bacterium]
MVELLTELIQRLRKTSLTDRQVLALFLASILLLTGLTVMWLATSTRSAMLAAELEMLEARHAQLTNAINTIWSEIGEITSPQAMHERARAAGYRPAARIEFIGASTTDSSEAMHRSP